jgi:chromosome segregation ATPase
MSIFQTNSQLRDLLAAAETENKQLAADLLAAQTELAEALKAKEELFAKVEDLDAKAAKAEADATAAKELMDSASKAQAEAEKSEAEAHAVANKQAVASVATIGAETVPQSAANEQTPDIIAQWQALSGDARTKFFMANKDAIFAATGK